LQRPDEADVLRATPNSVPTGNISLFSSAMSGYVETIARTRKSQLNVAKRR
jgi:hypothetical protein